MTAIGGARDTLLQATAERFSTTADGKASQGLLRTVKVHESVISRIANGTDRYAPITLPERFEIVPPQAEGENTPQAVSGSGAAPADTTGLATDCAKQPKPPLVGPDLRARLATGAVLEARARAFEAVYDGVWKRRVTYFVTLAQQLKLAELPETGAGGT